MKKWISLLMCMLLLIGALPAPAEDMRGSIYEIIGSEQLAEMYLADEYIYRQVPESVMGQAITAIGANAYSAEGLLILELPESITDIHADAFSKVSQLMLVANEGTAAVQFAAENGIAWINKADWYRLKTLKTAMETGMAGVPAAAADPAAKPKAGLSLADILKQGQANGGAPAAELATPTSVPATPTPVPPPATPAPMPEPVEGAVFPLTRESVSVYEDKISGSFTSTAAVRKDGTVVATAETWHVDELKDWTDILKVSCGFSHTLGLKTDGSVVACGYGYGGACEVQDWRNIVDIAAGDDVSLGLKSDGTVLFAGTAETGIDVSAWSDIVAVEAFDTMALGLKSDGTVLMSGGDDYGIDFSGVKNWTDIVDVAMTLNYVAGLKSNGTVVLCGFADEEELETGTWRNIVSVAASNFGIYGLKADGTVEYAGHDCGLIETESWQNIIAIAGGNFHCVGLKPDGALVAVGDEEDDANMNGVLDVPWTDICVEPPADVAARQASVTPKPAATPTPTPAPEMIEFSDAALENAIRNALGVHSGSVTSADMQRLTSLEIRDQEVDWTALEVLKHCTKLRSLTLSGCKLTDMGYIRNLSSLEYLDLSNNLLTDLDGSVLSILYSSTLGNEFGLTNLETLNLKRNPLHNIDLVARMTSLKELQLIDVPMSSGANNDMSRQLQALLIEKNYLYDDADGIFGNRTKEAVRLLQQDAGLEATGVVDEETVWALATQPAREFEPQEENGIILSNAYRGADGDIHFRAKNIGSNTMNGIQVAGQQLNSNKSPLGDLEGGTRNSNTYIYANWSFASPANSGESRNCTWSFGDGALFTNATMGKLWSYGVIDQNDKTISLFSNTRKPTGCVYFNLF